MQVFMRQIRLLGAGEAAAWAMEVTEKARNVSGLPISLWAAAAGLPTGSYAWSTPIEGMAQLTAANEQMMADESLAATVKAGREFIAEVMPDRVAQLVHGEIKEPAPVGSFMGSVSAVATEGNGVAAGAWAVKIANAWSDVTGLPVVVTTTTAGPMFEYGWFARHATAESIDEANAKLMASESYMTEVDSGGGLFHPGASQVYARRLA